MPGPGPAPSPGGPAARRPRPPGRRRLLLLVPPAAFLALFFLRPLWAMLRQAEGRAWEWLRLPGVQDRVATAFTQAGWSTLLALALALPVVVLHHRHRVHGGSALLALHATPFVLPAFVVAYGLQGTLFPLLPGLTPMMAVVAANAYFNYGFAARLALSHLERRPRRLEEAARVLGAPPWQAFGRASLPLLAGPLASVAVLVFLWCFASLGVVFLLGGGGAGPGGGVDTLETMMYRQLRGISPHPERAAMLGLLQLATGAALLALAFAARRSGRMLPAEATAPRPASLAATAASAALAALALVPLWAVLRGGFQDTAGWSLEPWRALLSASHPDHLAGFDFNRALANTLSYAAGSAALGLLLCACIAYGSRHNDWLRRAAEALASLTLGASGLLLGFGLLLVYGAGAALDLRATRTLILVTHTLLAFPFVCRVVLPAFRTLDPRLEDAARLLGAPPRSVAARVHLPTLWAPVLAAAGFALALSFGDIGSALLLMRPEDGGLAYWVLAHDVPFRPMLRAQSVALAGLVGALAIAAYAATQRAEVRA